MTDAPQPMNEIEAAAHHAKRAAEGAADAMPEEAPKGWSNLSLAIGVGVGSAAIAAALLYANSGRGKKKGA